MQRLNSGAHAPRTEPEPTAKQKHVQRLDFLHPQCVSAAGGEVNALLKKAGKDAAAPQLLGHNDVLEHHPLPEPIHHLQLDSNSLSIF